MTCSCQHPLLAPDAVPKSAGRLRIDHAALRRELGDDLGIREFMAPKASGRPTANVAVLWDYFTKAVYKSGDLPWLATRECLQNSLDACKAAIRARQLGAGDARFDVSWDPAQRALTFEDNGIGMDAETILTRFLSIGESGKRDAVDSGEAAGGFGVAKAVILGCSRSFRWDLHTRDNLAVGDGAGAEVQVFDARMRQGTKLTVFDVDPAFVRYYDRASGVHAPIEDRLRELLAANDLPGVTLTFDGVDVRPMFSRRGGSRVDAGGSWGDGTTAAVKAFRRLPGDRGGAWYLRLGGLFQVKVPAQRGNMRADVVVDLSTTVRPGAKGYPFNAARDALQDQASWAFADLVEEVERESESVGRSEEDLFIDPDDESSSDGADLSDQLAEAFADASVMRAVSDAAGGIRDFYAELARLPNQAEPTTSLAPRGTKARSDEPTRRAVLPPGVAFSRVEVVAPDVEAPSHVDAVRVLRAVLQPGGSEAAGAAALPDEVELALRGAEVGEAMNGWQVAAVEKALDRSAELALAGGGGGLFQAVAVSRAHTALAAVTDPMVTAMVQAKGQQVRNPFGRFAGLRIARKTYDRQRAARFRKGYAKWVPYLLTWDATLRLVAGEARIRRAFRPGFVLDDGVVGEAIERPNGRRFVFIHPDRFAAIVKAHRERPLAVAAFLHGVAVHELTHLDGRMGDGHDEGYVAAREDLGAATAHLLPAIAALASKLLGLAEPPSEATKRLARLERRLEAVRGTVRATRAEAARASRDRDRVVEEREAERDAVRLAFLRKAAESLVRPADRFLDALVLHMHRAAPRDLDTAYIDAFVERNREALLSVVRVAAIKHVFPIGPGGDA